ncbi:MAG: GTPase Era [Gemmatimonadales bacterium]|nr:MAG: GTPase Era [Gemmatimonadales bacterium]
MNSEANRLSTSPDDASTRAGFVAVAGLPNVGKSTLLNALVGAPLAAVSARAQTTVRTTRGVVTRDRSQSILLDLPGLLVPADLLQASIRREAERGLSDADVVLLVVDASRSADGFGEVVERLPSAARRLPLVVALNKADLAGEQELLRWEAAVCELLPGGVTTRTSAIAPYGLSDLLENVEAALPASPFLYPEDEIAAEPLRHFMAELVREAVFELFREEVPHATWARTEDFREGGSRERTYIQVTLWVERGSQKAILLGSKGAAIRELGVRSRKKIEAFLDRPVYLDLWVKVLPGWRRKRQALERFGFSLPPEGADDRGNRGSGREG